VSKILRSEKATKKTPKKPHRTQEKSPNFPEDWPKYFKDRLILENPNSTIGVITLWMPKEDVAENLESGTYSVCGQLYTKQGINYILRNILANPKIQDLIMCGADRQESGEALKKFFEKGFEKDPNSGGNLKAWKIKGDEKAFIHSQIPLDYLEKIRKNVKLYDLRKAALSEVTKKVSEVHNANQNTKPFCKPITFTEPEKTEPETYPSDGSVFKIRRDFVGDAWLDVLKTVTRFGHKIPGMYGDVGQVENLCVVIEKEDPDKPQMYDYFNFDKKQLNLYIKGFFDKNEEKSEIYTYGERIFASGGVNQAKIMVEKLKRFEHDRGAVVVLWKPKVDNFPPEDVVVQEIGQTKKWRVPCLVMLLGQVTDGNLNMSAIFRNNDVYGAWPLNAFSLRAFQKDIAKKIGKGLGTLTTISHIAEIYELNWEESKMIVQENDSLGRTCQYDPRGYYVITVEDPQINVVFYSPDGSKELASHSIDGTKDKAARDLSAMVLKDMLVSDLGAACDLGRQLAKAESAVKLGLEFEQDQPLKFKS